MVVLVVALAVAGVATGAAQADALMPDGERIDAVVRAGRTIPDTGAAPAVEPRAERSPSLPVPELIVGVSAAVAAAGGVAAAGLIGRRRLRPA